MPLCASEKPKGHWFFTRFPQAVERLPVTLTLADSALAHHVKTVMRLRPGESLVLVNEPEAQAYVCQLESLQAKQVAVTLLERLPTPSSPKIPLMAAVALIKGPRWDWLLQKLTELGVSDILPLVTRRTVVDVKDPAAKHERWTEILKNAAEQSERVMRPQLHGPMTLEQLVAETQARAGCFALLATERGGMPLAAVLQSPPAASCMVFAIGPEGGWDPAEQALLQAGGFHAVSLGDKILRSETAALYLGAVLDYVADAHAHQSHTL